MPFGMDSTLLNWALIASLAGFLFGFDTVVISGAEETIQYDVWQMNGFIHGIVMSSAIFGTVIGSLIGGPVVDKYGRRPVLIGIGIAYTVSAVGCGVVSSAPSGKWVFAFFRALGGVGVGVATVAAPMYISELSPPEHRGRLTGLFQFLLVVGILCAFVSNLILTNVFDKMVAWRWMLGVEGIPASIYAVLAIWLPESPRWLILQGRVDEAEVIMQQASKDDTLEDVKIKIEEIADGAVNANPHSSFWTPRIKTPRQLAFVIAFLNQMSGINALLYYSKRIFQDAGMKGNAGLISGIGVGAVNLVATMLGVYLVDRMGRRTLMIIGSIGHIITLTLVSIAYFTNQLGLVAAMIFCFIFFFAIGQGTVVWVFISEIFPAAHRGTGQTFGSFIHWFTAAVITLLFPVFDDLLEKKNGPIFVVFDICVMIQLWWVLKVMPETKGRTLEEVQNILGVAAKSVSRMSIQVSMMKLRSKETLL